ncbi:putative reverse transcriptase domain-containing protein [Tanacetum coccineum]|uniref:Reverse transcriptase domain-containing protein n=1 Tax=Tanacetum coccineum TaxID=301880 RepID=A0ABQ5B524_9ASTR
MTARFATTQDTGSSKRSFQGRQHSSRNVERIWVPVYGNLRTLIMNEAHATRYSIHPGVDKMYYDLRGLYWWPGIRKDIAMCVSECLTCSTVKVEHQKPSRLLQ